MNLGFLGFFFRAVRRRSLTFSILFAAGLLGGVSIAGWVRAGLSRLDLWTPLVWLGPLLLFAWLARHEERLKLRPEFRRLCCFLLVFGAVGLTFMLWRYRSHVDAIYPEPASERERFLERRRGPRGR